MHQPDIGLALIHNPLIHSADVIFVHGLRGHRSRTWETKSGKFWLEWLGERLPQIRVWSYGYNAHTVSGSQDVFHIYATQFLEEMSSHLSHNQINPIIEKPIVFVAHSLGGILVKKAMILASSAESRWNCIFRNIAGIVFLGTPHRGSPLASAASSICKFFPGSSQLLPILQANSSTLAQIAEQFNSFWGARPLFSFRETTWTHGFMVVPEENAVTNCQKETVYDIPRCNHSEISKPDSINGFLFTRILYAILSLLQPKSADVHSSNVGLHNPESLVNLPLPLVQQNPIGSIRNGDRMWPTTARPNNRRADSLYQELHNLKGGVRPHTEWHCLNESGGARWLGGSYSASFVADQSGTTTIRVQVSDHHHQFSWSISSPQSLWYPGTHTGTITLPSDFPSTPPKIHFSTQIFSPHVNHEGAIGPGITNGDAWGSEVTILDILHDIAAMLVVSPTCRWDTVLYRLLPRLRPHTVLKRDVMTFFDQNKEAFLRATNFFSRAFAQDGNVLEANRVVTPDDVEGTVLTITELIDHFENGRSRVLPYGFSKNNVRPTFERVQTLQEFRGEEKRWARALQTICHS